MSQVVQLVGAVLVLAGFGLAQLEVVDSRSYSYLMLNLVGATLLAVLAVEAEQWGFLLLESVWALVALFGLLARVRVSARARARRRGA